MGLDTTHNCYHGSYSGFNRFRYSLGHQIGIDLNDYIGYGISGTKDLTSIKHELMPLFNHSDCDGRLTIKECKSIAKGLDKILENFNDKIESDFNLKDLIIQFRDGCLHAVSLKQMVKFQ